MATQTKPPEGLQFAEVEIPTSEGRSEPNPFDGVFPRDEKAIQLTVDGDAKGTAVNKVRNQARRAAQAVDRTARVKVGETKSGKTPVTVWTVPRQTRPRKDENGNAPANGSAAE